MDIDGDGVMDILSGCYSQRGYKVMVGSFWVLRGLKQGGFAKPEELKGSDGKTLMVHPGKERFIDWERSENTCTRPFAADWDGDGDLDIVTGNFRGNFFLFEGEGAGKFSPKATLLKSSDGKMLRTGGKHSDPFLVDWDGDGDLDLLATSTSAKVVRAENTRAPGQSGPPVLRHFEVLLSGLASGKKPGPRGSTRMHIEDVNGDGKLDILMGDNGMVAGGDLREDLSEDEQAKYDELMKERAAVMARFRKAREPWDRDYAKALKEGGELSEKQRVLLQRELVRDKMAENEDYQRLKELATERGFYQQPYVRRGFVWLFTQR